MELNENYIDVWAHIENVTIGVIWSLAVPKAKIKANFNNLLHDHAYSEVFVALKGETLIHLDNETILLQENDAIIIPPNLFHIKEAKENSIALAVGFTCNHNNQKYFYDVYKRLRHFMVGFKPIICRNCPDFCEIIKNIIENPQKTAPYINALAFAKALLEISDLTLKQTTTLTDTHYQSDVKDVKLLTLIDDIISGRYYQNINAEEVAEKLFISRRQLDRIAKKRFGMPFYSVIIQKRVITAAELLINTDLRIEQIALNVGFNSSNSLYNAFEKHFKCTPNEFRNRNNQLNRMD